MQTRSKRQASQHAGGRAETEKPQRATKKRRAPLPTPAAAEEETPDWGTKQLLPWPRRRGTLKPPPSEKGLSKAPQAAQGSDLGTKGREDKILINRAPVLNLWVAVVAMREGYSYEEGLSFGRVITGILAQSKGRHLGLYEEPSEEEKEERRRKRKELDRFPVFGMNIAGKTTQEGLRLGIQSGKPIMPGSVADYLRRSFGPNYERAKGAMEELANSFRSEEIGRAAYSLYEKFRPTVPYGVKGWGAKGLLDVESMQALRKA